MLSPTLALRCAQCQHALALSDLRDTATCPACHAPHGVPGAVIDSLALYEAAIRQSVTDLLHNSLAGAAAAPAAAPGEPIPAERRAAPEAPARREDERPPPQSILATGPRTARPEPTGPAAVPPATMLGFPVPQPTREPEPAPTSVPPVSAPPTGSAELVAPPTGAPLTSSAELVVPDTLPGVRRPTASNSSLMSVLSARSSTDLADAPLLVAATQEPGPTDTQPVRATSDLAAAVRQVLPDRQAPAPSAGEGRIPAAALAVARRVLLARYADERRQQLVKDGDLLLFFAAVLCVFFIAAGYWYVAIPIALVAVLLRLRREEKSERFGAEVQRLADALGGQRIAAHDAITAWFDALWPAPVSPEAMWTSHLHGAVRCEIDGYSALLDVHLNEKTSGGQVYPPRITAYLAAAWPGRLPSLRLSSPDLAGSAGARLGRLRKAGYSVAVDPNGGLIMRVSESIAAAAVRDITRLPALQVPLGELAALARDLGADPIPAP